MNKKKEKIFFLLIAVLILVCSFNLSNQQNSIVTAQPEPLFELDLPEIEYKEREVYIILYLANMFQFNYKAGSYLNDMFIVFLWSDPNINEIDWHIVNGLPIHPGAKSLVSDNFTKGEIRGEAWKVTASLFTPLQATDYPFDQIELPITIEVFQHGYRQSLVWETSASGINPDFENVGWNDPTIKFLTSRQNYTLGADIPRASFVVVQSRDTIAGVVTTLVVPLLFCGICAFSFLLSMQTGGTLAARIGLNSSVLVSTILYNNSVVNSIPPTTQLTFWTAYITSVLSFLSIGLIIPIMGFVEFTGKKREKRFRQLNRWGIMIAVLIPIVLFTSLYFLK